MANNIRPTDWADRSRHYLKRSLSSYEKSTLRPEVTHGQALLMPGAPNTEIEELLAVGFSPRNLHCIEEVEAVADILYEHYWETVSVHILEASEFLGRASTLFSYIHLDYCGFLGRAERTGIEYAIAKLDTHARLRTSIMLSRRPQDQRDDERMIAERILNNLAIAAATHDDTGGQRWRQVVERIDYSDALVSVAAIMIINILFGMTAYDFSDACAAQEPFLPDTWNRPRILGIHRYVYNEPNNSNVMGTVWVDLAPGLIAGGYKLATEELFMLMHALVQPAIPYANPQIFS